MRYVLLLWLLLLSLPAFSQAGSSRNDDDKDTTTAAVAPRQEQDPAAGIAAVVLKDKPRWAPALATNLMYDLGLTPNIGLEFPMGQRLSLAASWHYAWWHLDEQHYYWQTYGGTLALRWWFSPRKGLLTGHHLGAYGQMLTYDFEFGGRGEQAARWQYGGGLEYGYSVRLSQTLRLDLHLGAGFLGGTFERYEPHYGYYVWEETVRRRWLGPTTGGITLVWLLQRREGARR